MNEKSLIIHKLNDKAFRICKYLAESILGKRFILYQHLMNNILRVFSDMFFIFFAQLIRVDWLAVFYHNFCRFYFRKVGFEDIGRIADCDRNDRAFCFCSDLEASFMEWEHIELVLVSVSGPFREDTDGNSGFYFIDRCQDGFQTLFDIFSVKEKAVKVMHPCRQERDFLHFFFGNVACADRAAGIGKKNVEVASVVADIKYRCVLWHIFFSDHSNLCTGDLKDKSEYCLDDPKGADILLFRRKSADDPFDQQDGDGQDQVSDHNNTDKDKSYHSLIPFRALYNADAHI